MIWSFYEMLWFFYFYSSLGWSVEVVYEAVKTGRFVNRGFFHGPLCPIYGIAVLFTLIVLTPFKDNLVLLFAASTIFTSTVEFFTGLILEKVFHNKWWDYSSEPFNIKGYICLKISVIWGLSCSAAFFVLQPGLEYMVHFASRKAGIIAQIILTAVFLVDMTATIIEIENIKRKFRVVDEIAARIHAFSDKVGNTLYGGTMFTMNKSKSIKYSVTGRYRKYKKNRSTQKENRLADKELLMREQQELMYLLKEYKHLISRKSYYLQRIVLAYPTLRKNRLEKLSREKKYVDTLIKKIRWERGESRDLYKNDDIIKEEELEGILESFLEEEFYPGQYDMEQDIMPQQKVSGE